MGRRPWRMDHSSFRQVGARRWAMWPVYCGRQIGRRPSSGCRKTGLLACDWRSISSWPPRFRWLCAGGRTLSNLQRRIQADSGGQAPLGARAPHSGNLGGNLGSDRTGPHRHPGAKRLRPSSRKTSCFACSGTAIPGRTPRFTVGYSPVEDPTAPLGVGGVLVTVVGDHRPRSRRSVAHQPALRTRGGLRPDRCRRAGRDRAVDRAP